MGSPADDGPADKPAAARTGARFPTEKQLEMFDQPEPEAPEQEPEASQPKPSPRPRAESRAESYQWPSREPAAPLPRFDDDLDAEDAVGPRVRPYVLTKGRTQSNYELALETLVNVRADAKWIGAALNSEYQPVRALCLQPVSVAEVAANLSIPLGVARVLLSDMAELGLLHIHGTERTAEGRPPMALMRRVLDGLQRL
jgi:hypothetical protein